MFMIGLTMDICVIWVQYVELYYVVYRKHANIKE